MSPARRLAVVALGAAFWAYWPVVDAPMVADDVELSYAAAIGKSAGERTRLIWNFSTQSDWFRPLYGLTASGVFALAGPENPRPHRVLLLLCLFASVYFFYRAAALVAGEKAALFAAFFYLFTWAHWSTAASIVALSSAAAQCAFFAALWLALKDARAWPWAVATAVGLGFKEDLIVFPAVALAVQGAMRPTRKQFQATLGAGALVAAGYWLVRRAIIGEARVVVPGNVPQWRPFSEWFAFADYARVWETFATPATHGFSLSAAWLPALVAGAAFAWTLERRAHPLHETSDNERRAGFALAALLFLIGIWPYAGFVNGLSDVQRTARSAAGLALAFGLLAASLPRFCSEGRAILLAALFAHTAAAYSAPDYRKLPFLTAYMHRETRESEKAASRVLEREWRAGDFALFKGFGPLRVSKLLAIRGRLSAFEWRDWREEEKNAPADARWPANGTRLWLVERFWISPIKSRLLVTRYPDVKTWEFSWGTD